MSKIKVVLIEFIKQVLKLFFIFPIHKNRIMFSAYSGKQYSCNPKYISEYILENYRNSVEVYWAFVDPNEFAKLDSDIKKIKFKSFAYIYYTLTSGVIIDNVESWSILPRRKEQLVINTWHGGGAYKGVGLQRNDTNSCQNENMLNKHKRVSLYLSSSKAFTKMTLRDSFHYDGRVMECGMPRNDILIHGVNKKTITDIRKKIGVTTESLVLYAPTFRNDKNYKSTLDYERLLKVLESRFGDKWKILYRGHYYSKIKTNRNLEKIVDVSEYSDMQELLLISDILVTDYSSSMWDFSLMKKPCFLYADDIGQYNQEREFYTPISTWPFPLAENNEELEYNIRQFNEGLYERAVEMHHKQLGNCEKGEASMLVANQIMSYVTK